MIQIVPCPTCGIDASCQAGNGLSFPARAPDWRAIGYGQVHRCRNDHGFVLRESGPKKLDLVEFADRFNSSPMARRHGTFFDTDRGHLLHWGKAGPAHWVLSEGGRLWFTFAFTPGSEWVYRPERLDAFPPMTSDTDVALLRALYSAMYVPEGD